MLKILLPVDGSVLSLDAVHHALALVHNGLRASFVLANVQEPASLYELVTAPNADVLEKVSESAGEHLLEGAQALCTAAGVPFESEIASGDPAHTLLEIAERYGCDAIVMGARGSGVLRTALVGSVSYTVMHDAQVPVTIVKHADAEGDGDSEEGDAETDGEGDGE
jgi:nucleotide-binding universal stress UspA family protein